MQSTLTEPIGPRSPDEILGLVYQRTHHVRRRRRQTLAAAVAMVAMGIAGLVSLRPGDDRESRVRVVDDRHTQVDDGTTESATATTVAAESATTTTTARSGARGRQTSGGGGANTPTGPPLPTTTTTPTLPEGPGVRLLAQASDNANDADLPGWYWDVVGGSMELDGRADMVVFTTRYGTPDENGTRAARTLRASFDYENNPITVDVDETNNTLGEVSLDGGDCNGCVPVLDVATATLTVRIPVTTMNAHLVTLEGAGASIESAVVSSLIVSTSLPGDTQQIDSSED